ncbi:MAG: hypothetical protein RML12_09955 [Xanthomonadales bacterium]|nr:hypothetical protein [Xanthomonadales bacterium]
MPGVVMDEEGGDQAREVLAQAHAERLAGREQLGRHRSPGEQLAQALLGRQGPERHEGEQREAHRSRGGPRPARGGREPDRRTHAP